MASLPGITAKGTFHAQAGVCRGYAHVLRTWLVPVLPARFVSVYVPRVAPQDFHAVAQVWLEGAWHIIDATGMAELNEVVRMRRF